MSKGWTKIESVRCRSITTGEWWIIELWEFRVLPVCKPDSFEVRLTQDGVTHSTKTVTTVVGKPSASKTLAMKELDRSIACLGGFVRDGERVISDVDRVPEGYRLVEWPGEMPAYYMK